MCQVFISEPYFVSMVRDTKISMWMYLGSVGGWLGLCVGLSIISAAQKVYNLCRNIWAYQRANQEDVKV